MGFRNRDGQRRPVEHRDGALLTLLSAERRLPYKVSKVRSYWPDASPVQHHANVTAELDRIAAALSYTVADVPTALLTWQGGASPESLKRREDALGRN
jgi:hypothetical protein